VSHAAHGYKRQVLQLQEKCFLFENKIILRRCIFVLPIRIKNSFLSNVVQDYSSKVDASKRYLSRHAVI
jgi:hypothetical protein